MKRLAIERAAALAALIASAVYLLALCNDFVNWYDDIYLGSESACDTLRNYGKP